MIRFLDILISLILIIFLGPLLAMAIIVSWLDTGSPLFVQERMGRRKRSFRLLKLRTMKNVCSDLPTHEVPLSAVSVFGRMLRKYKIDEIPQLFNVIAGHMSLVGPRPNLLKQSEVIKYRDKLGVYELMPGITGVAQIEKVDMSRPFELARLDASRGLKISMFDYFSILLRTIVGRGFGDNLGE